MKRNVSIFRQCRGFSLVELLVSMAVFLIVIAIAGDTFNNIISLVSKYSKSEESNIEGIVGLEIIRHDLEQMGFGLPWQFSSGSTVSYAESVTANALTNDFDKTSRDISSENMVPRPFVALDNSAAFSSEFFGVKATTVGISKTSQQWTYIPFHNFSTATVRESRPVAWPSNNLKSDDNNMVIAVRSNFNDSNDDHVLADNSGSYSLYIILLAGSIMRFCHKMIRKLILSTE